MADYRAYNCFADTSQNLSLSISTGFDLFMELLVNRNFCKGYRLKLKAWHLLILNLTMSFQLINVSILFYHLLADYGTWNRSNFYYSKPKFLCVALELWFHYKFSMISLLRSWNAAAKILTAKMTIAKLSNFPTNYNPLFSKLLFFFPFNLLDQRSTMTIFPRPEIKGKPRYLNNFI